MANIYLDEDQILIQRIREEEDENAFNILYKKYGAEVYSNSFSLLKDHALAQDVIQDIFVSLWINRKKLQINNVKAYLHVAARNRILRIFEKKKHFVPFEDLIDISVKASSEESADYLTLRHEFLQAYKHFVNLLPSQRKRIFDSYFEEGLSTGEIAAQLSLSRKTVQNQIGRAVSFLKDNLSHLSNILLTFIP